MLHKHNGSCDYCNKIMDRYPGFHVELRVWFREAQMHYRNLHTSCAGRDRIEQEAARIRGASRARFGQSAHNYNAALDLFWIENDKAIWDRKRAGALFNQLLPLPDWIQWGALWPSFPELAHFEVANWKFLVKNGDLTLVSE